MIEPGGCIGILGGGQLGRMLALAAAPLGYRCHIFAPENDPPAGQVAAVHTQASYDDQDALAAFAHAVDVITFEFENVPAESLDFLAALKPLRPSVFAQRIAQDRLPEKEFITAQGAVCAPYRAVDDLAGLKAAVAQIGLPAILKTRRLGYDGKGQVKIEAAQGDDDTLARAYDAMAGAAAILEDYIPFEREISVLAARGVEGEFSAYEPVENSHRNHILHRSRVPAAISEQLADEAIDIARRIITALEYVGVLAIEFFVTTEGTLLVNEMAPRVHNSGHWTIEGAVTSQFEQHIRAICGLPLGDTASLGEVEMINLIGEDWRDWPQLIANAGDHLHLYGKSESRPGRKMGHVTRLKWLANDD